MPQALQEHALDTQWVRSISGIHSYQELLSEEALALTCAPRQIQTLLDWMRTHSRDPDSGPPLSRYLPTLGGYSTHGFPGRHQG